MYIVAYCIEATDAADAATADDIILPTTVRTTLDIIVEKKSNGLNAFCLA